MSNGQILFPEQRSSLVSLQRFLCRRAFDNTHFIIVIDENTYSHCLPELIANVSRLEDAEFFEVPVGEGGKELAIAEQLWHTLLEGHVDREAVVLNLGGGSVCDLGGFVASQYKRGLRFINIPTTLTAMVDAAIGGKNAVNLNGVKNVVGNIRLPEAVCIHTPFLSSLPVAQVESGLFEALKTLLLCDEALYHRLVNGLRSGVREASDEMIRACAQFKQAVVKQDLYDGGVRRMLNLGHTVGHAVEAFSMRPGRKTLMHGQAVGVGMCCELYLSHRKLGFPKEEYDLFCSTASRMFCFPHYSLPEVEELVDLMHQDKKCQQQQVRCTMMQDIGTTFIDEEISDNVLRDALLKL